MKISEHKKKFGSNAKDYTKYRKPYTGKVFDLFFSLVPTKSPRILDVACGTGKSTEPLVQKEAQVFGIDHDPQMIEEAISQAKVKNLPITYSVADVEHLPFEKEHLDAVTVGTAFHWFVNKKSMKEISRVLKPKGLLFVYWTLTTKEIPEEDEIPSSIFRAYGWEKVPPKLRNLEYIKSFFEENGFTEIKTLAIPFVYGTTVEERVGLLKTGSAYELLSPEDKQKFLKEVEDLLIKKLGSRSEFKLEEEIHICYGFKK
jgi:SAM-dependent methyltransferase